MIEKVNESFILYDSSPTLYIRDYYNFIVSQFKHVISPLSVNVIIGSINHDFKNSKKTYKVHINYEHILVRPGGRDSSGSPMGSNDYLVRLVNKAQSLACDIYVDYSMPNLKHLQFLGPNIYMAPIIYPLQLGHNKKDILTTFIRLNERRSKLIHRLRAAKLPHKNINNCFDTKQLQDLYLSTKIMVNIHQTDHHHTLEELRVLPALLCGVVVICEDSPYKEHIPYKDFLVWSHYDDIPDVVAEVNANYETYYEKLKDPKLMDVCKGMQTQIHNDLMKLLA